MFEAETRSGGGLGAMDALLLKLFPSGEFSGPGYILSCALLFTVCGLIVGYFIWKKGHLQTLDAESEIFRTELELNQLRGDLNTEEQLLRESDLTES